MAFSIHEPFIFLALPKGFPVTFSFFFPVALGNARAIILAMGKRNAAQGLERKMRNKMPIVVS